MPREVLAAALAGLDPRSPRRCAGGRPGHARPPGAAPCALRDPGRRRQHGHRALCAGPAGGRLRARRAGRLSLLGGHERDPGPGRRGHRDRGRVPAAGAGTAASRIRRCWPPASCSGSPRCTRPAARRRSRCSATARPTAPPVDTITGPGNIYVAAAKRLLQGTVSTDAEAGPTEVAIIADADGEPGFVAADLIAQAEHDSLAACLLITTDEALADQVDAELDRQLADRQARRAGQGGAERPVGLRAGRRPRRRARGRRRLGTRASGDPGRRR